MSSVSVGWRTLHQTGDIPWGRVTYAAAPGRVAYDGVENNSPFSAALADYLLLPGQTIDQIMKLVGRRVYAETSGAQMPWATSSMRSEFVPSGARIDKAKMLATYIFDDWTSYVVTYKALKGVTLACGASLIHDWKGDVFRRIATLDEIRLYLAADHFTAYHTFSKFEVPYFCQLFCQSGKAAYCRDVEVMKAIRDRLKVVTVGERSDALSKLKLPILGIPNDESSSGE